MDTIVFPFIFGVMVNTIAYLFAKENIFKNGKFEVIKKKTWYKYVMSIGFLVPFFIVLVVTIVGLYMEFFLES